MTVEGIEKCDVKLPDGKLGREIEDRRDNGEDLGTCLLFRPQS